MQIRERSVFKTIIRGWLVESAPIAAKIVGTFVDSNHITYIIGIAFVHKCQNLNQAPMLDRILITLQQDLVVTNTLW